VTSTPDRDYVLGTHDAEIERLGVQHRVWRPRMLDACRRAGLTVGRTAVDLGCGPGYATLDLAEIVGSSGHVHAIDRSDRFLAALGARLRAQGITHVSTYGRDLDEEGWPEIQADLVWCRWVAAFVRQPRAFVDRMRGLVRPGGRVVMHEYLDYSAWRLLPDAPEFEAFVEAVIAAWRQAGGEPNVGRDLPGWLEDAGFRVDDLRPIMDVVSPADFIWQWPRAFVEVGLDRLVAIGMMAEPRAAEIWREFLTREALPHVRMATPTVLEILATRH
jgi:SAM-dependent methyltransferase